MLRSSDTIIECQGEESCAETSIRARYVQMIYCGGFRACENAMIMVTEPKKNFLIRCIGIESCYGLRVIVNLPGPPNGFRCADGATSAIIPFGGIICANDHSCEYMDVTISNDGCDSVEMDKTSANGACNSVTYIFLVILKMKHVEATVSGH